MLGSFASVALGGALGAMARYGVGLMVVRAGQGGFPVAVILVNVLGSFLMGALVVYLGQKSLTHLSPLLMTGVLGGFTTFSAFSLEAVTLFERGDVGQAAVYVVVSVVVSIAALMFGIWIMRGALT